MAKQSRSEQLDQFLDAELTRPETALPRAGAKFDAKLVALMRVASDLRGLPRETFKAKLKANLLRRGSMASKPVAAPQALKTAMDRAGAVPTGETALSKVKFIREGFRTVTLYLAVHQAAELIDFVKQAFGAEETFRGTGSAGGLHAEVRIGDSMLMIGGGGAFSGTPTPASLHFYVRDVDAAYELALRAGGTSMQAPVDQFYGDREAGVKDLAGNQWYISTNKATGYAPPGFHSVTPFLHPRGAPAMIDFLKRAFAAEETSREESPDGIVQHAIVRIGDSFVEMGEAHGDYQPMPSMFHLYVDDVDAWYARAVAAGAVAQGPPTDQPYGDRVGNVLDPFGNDWYIATHIKDVAP
jgi:PhnB protein